MGYPNGCFYKMGVEIERGDEYPKYFIFEADEVKNDRDAIVMFLRKLLEIPLFSEAVLWKMFRNPPGCLAIRFAFGKYRNQIAWDLRTEFGISE